ncbi:uncharacterized protein LOC130284967 [Hyla sarda]|uniref:uncharacterized protein LOC130284967 n=1 Tax=Hyla sarda TaxID=327740 RepID=UPI0024C2CA70|nr:uncharacterized protein LOC130284967 [Hyla sarda]
MNMAFTSVFGGDSLEFLDLKLYVENNQLLARGYRKEVARNALLHYKSSHPIETKNSIPYSQLLRLKRNNSKQSDYEEQAGHLLTRFRQRQYPNEVLARAYRRAATKNREDLLIDSKNKIKDFQSTTEQNSRFMFAFKNSPLNHVIKSAITKNWHLLMADPDIVNTVQNRPTVTFRKNKTIADLLKGQKFNREAHPKETWLSGIAPKGNKNCGFCPQCPHNINAISIKLGSYVFEIKHLITCRSTFVVYFLCCSCQFFYIGKTERQLRARVREHMYSVRKGGGSPTFVQHMQSIHGGNCTTLKFGGLETIPCHPSGGDRRRLLLRAEARWILRLDAQGPLGLNDKLDFSPFFINFPLFRAVLGLLVVMYLPNLLFASLCGFCSVHFLMQHGVRVHLESCDSPAAPL